MKIQFQILLFSALCVFIPMTVSDASAGVLLRSQRVRSQTRSRPPKISLGRAVKSTQVSGRLNPIRSGGYNTPDVVLKQVRAQQKYEKKLYRWRLKQAKLISKERAKLKRKQEIEADKAKKLREKQKRAKDPAKNLLGRGLYNNDSEKEKSIKDVGEGKATEKVLQGEKIEGSAPKKKLSFWTRLWNAMFKSKPKANQ